MSQQIVQVNFQFKGSVEEYKRAAEMVTKAFAALPGLLWKIWLVNEDSKEGGGIYLFANKTVVDNYKNSDIFKSMLANPDYINFSIKQYDMLEGPGKTTHAPAGEQLVIL